MKQLSLGLRKYLINETCQEVKSQSENGFRVREVIATHHRLITYVYSTNILFAFCDVDFFSSSNRNQAIEFLYKDGNS